MTTCMDPSCRLLAAQYLRKQCKQLLAQFAGIRQATDVEFIHRARVASRRLRAALQIFGDCLPQKPLKGWKKQIRRITEELGEARDLDVQREYLVEVMAHLEQPVHRPGVARLLVRTDLQRDRIQRKVLKALRGLEKSQILQEMRKSLKRVSQGQADADLLHTEACFRMAEHHISERLGEMLSLEDGLEDPDDCQQHHAMRIAAKRLRYTMEICRPVYRERIDAALEATKQLQSLLGDIHDCDVWKERLPGMLEEERQWIVRRYGQAGPLEWLRPGVEHLIQRCQEQRDTRFGELAQFWQEHVRRATWTGLAEILRGAISLAAGGPSADEPESEARRQQPVAAPVQAATVGADGNGASPSGSKKAGPPGDC